MISESPKRQKIISRLLVTGVLLIAAGVALITYWTLQSDNVLVVHNSPFPTRIIKDDKGSGVVILSTDYCKNVDINGKVRVSFVSPTREVFLPISDEKQEAGCRKVDVPVVIPKDLLPDTYKIKFRATYNINPFKSAVISEFESKTFKVE